MEECIPATVNSSGKMQQVCRVCSEIRNVSVIDSPQKAVWNKTDFTYDGKVKKPAAAVKDSKGKTPGFPVAGIVSCAFSTSPQTPQWLPSVFPASVSVGSTLGSVTSV